MSQYFHDAKSILAPQISLPGNLANEPTINPASPTADASLSVAALLSNTLHLA
jgi:hypothetical protein